MGHDRQVIDPLQLGMYLRLPVVVWFPKVLARVERRHYHSIMEAKSMIPSLPARPLRCLYLTPQVRRLPAAIAAVHPAVSPVDQR